MHHGVTRHHFDVVTSCLDLLHNSKSNIYTSGLLAIKYAGNLVPIQDNALKSDQFFFFFASHNI